MIVADAMVQELLVSLVEMRMSEKEALVLDEVDNVESMRKLHVELKQEERRVRNQAQTLGRSLFLMSPLLICPGSNAGLRCHWRRPAIE